MFVGILLEKYYFPTATKKLHRLDVIVGIQIALVYSKVCPKIYKSVIK